MGLFSQLTTEQLVWLVSLLLYGWRMDAQMY